MLGKSSEDFGALPTPELTHTAKVDGAARAVGRAPCKLAVVVDQPKVVQLWFAIAAILEEPRPLQVCGGRAVSVRVLLVPCAGLSRTPRVAAEARPANQVRSPRWACRPAPACKW